jgi:hypothetical protein
MAIGDVCEDVEVATIGAPCRQLHTDKRRPGDLDRKERRLLVRESFNPKARMQVAHSGSQAIEVLPTRLRHAVDIEGRSLGAVCASGNASDQQVLHLMTGEGIGDPFEIRPFRGRCQAPGVGCLAASSASISPATSAHQESTASLLSSLRPSLVMDTSSEVGGRTRPRSNSSRLMWMTLFVTPPGYFGGRSRLSVPWLRSCATAAGAGREISSLSARRRWTSTAVVV